MPALYTPDGSSFVPQPLTTGPWDRSAQHGGPPAALLARAVEAVEAPAPVRVARITFELLRPVPLTPLAVRTEVVRPGRKVQLVQASLHTGPDDREVMRATALRVRTSDLPLPADTPIGDGGADAPPLPDDVARTAIGSLGPDADWPAFHRDATEIRFVDGSFDAMGPATAWVRLTAAVVAGEEPSPVMRAVATADFGNGFSRVLGREWLFVNPDLTVHLSRPPEGEWIGLAATTWATGDGIGLAEGALFDRFGRVGRSVQSLLLDRADGGSGRRPS